MRRRRRWIGAAAALAIAALALSACGSSGSSSSSSQPAGNTASNSSQSPSNQATISANISTINSIVTQSMQRPTTTILPKTTKPIPTGKSLYYINCGVPLCAAISSIVKQAGAILDWQVTVINTDGSTPQVDNAWEQVLRAKPTGVIYAGFNTSEVATYTEQAAAAGTVVAAFSINTGRTDGISYVADGYSSQGPVGTALAAYIMQDAYKAGVSDPQVVYINVPDIPANVAIGNGMQSTLKQYCSACGYATLSIGAADLANADSEVISYLRAHPQTKYVVMSVDTLFPGLPAALKSSGLTGINLLGNAAGSADLTAMASGEELANEAANVYESSLACVDAIASKVAGDPIPPDLPYAVWIITKDNAPQASSDGLYTEISDPYGYFTNLWDK